MAKSGSGFGLEKGNVTRDLRQLSLSIELNQIRGVPGSLSDSNRTIHVLISHQDSVSSPVKFGRSVSAHSPVFLWLDLPAWMIPDAGIHVAEVWRLPDRNSTRSSAAVNRSGCASSRLHVQCYRLDLS